MRNVPLYALVVLALSLTSSPLWAEGAGCDKSKGHHKELSAEAKKEHGSALSWLFEQKKSDSASSSDSESAPAAASEPKTGKLLEI